MSALLGACCLAVLTAATGPDEPRVLGLRWAAGQTLTYRLTAETRTLYRIGMPQGSHPAPAVETFTLTLAVREVLPDGVARLTATLQGEPINSPWLGHPYALTVAANGAILTVKGPEGDELKWTLVRAFQLLAGPPVTVGGKWAGTTEVVLADTGKVQIDHRFVLKAVESGPDGAVARIAATIEAHRDAAGQIPLDLSEEGLDYELDSLEGNGELMFDVALGQPRRASSTLRLGFVNRDTMDNHEQLVQVELELITRLELLKADGPRPPVPPLPPPPAPETLPEFAAFDRQLRERCFVSPLGTTNGDTKGAEAGQARCLQRTVVAELDRVLLPLKAADPPRFDALMKEQADWNRYVADVCWLSEESEWVDLDAHQRDDGTLRTYARLACEQRVSVERAYYAQARRLGEAAGLARRVQAQAAAAEPVRRYLQAVQESMRKWKPSAEAPHRPWPLAESEVRELDRRAGAIRDRARELGAATCRGWPELAQAVGPAPCEATLEGYYLAQGPKGR